MTLLTTKQVAEMSGIPANTILTWVERGVITPAYTLGKGRGRGHRFSEEQLQRLLDTKDREPRAIPLYIHLDDAQMQCIGSYADNAFTRQLATYIDNEEELARLNKARGEEHTMRWFNQLIGAAIALRNSQIPL